ncbi:MAG TPA: hypothetical protein VMV05_04085 [bacterium]|nr:hypothetical protein [bacterium]
MDSSPRYNVSMFFKLLITATVLWMVSGASSSWAQTTEPITPENDEGVTTGFAKPYAYEQQAQGYDPEGIDYKENQAEDFQVIFVTSMPFTALASFGITGLVSLVSGNNFGVGGDYFLPFLAGTAIGATTIACVSVFTNKYPPPQTNSFVDSALSGPSLAFKIPLVQAEF